MGNLQHVGQMQHALTFNMPSIIIFVIQLAERRAGPHAILAGAGAKTLLMIESEPEIWVLVPALMAIPNIYNMFGSIRKHIHLTLAIVTKDRIFVS